MLNMKRKSLFKKEGTHIEGEKGEKMVICRSSRLASNRKTSGKKTGKFLPVIGNHILPHKIALKQDFLISHKKVIFYFSSDFTLFNACNFIKTTLHSKKSV